MNQNENRGADEMSIRDVVITIRSFIKYLRIKWLILIICGLFGAAAGLSYSIYKKPLYTASSSFVLEDDKSSSLSQYANLASMVGIDMGGTGGGVFQGDNIIALYTSKTMLAKTLLDTADFNGRHQLLIDRYVDFLHLREKWAKKGYLNISFNIPFQKFNRVQDSLLMDIVSTINKSLLIVSKPDKKLNIINVDVYFGDELFAKNFNNKLVATVNEFYIQSKTRKSASNVAVLQKQVDSVKLVLNNSIGGVASALDAAPNANPALLSLRVPSQRKQIDVQASSAIYAEIVKNLELAKIGLMQEKPLIQIIDDPILPLDVKKVGKITASLVGFFLAILFTIVWLGAAKVYGKLMN